jgi:hypothetical protein
MNRDRRTVLGTLVAGVVSIPVAGLLTRADAAAALPALDPADPTAKALGYVTDAKKVDAKANATYKPGQQCANCVQYQGKKEDKSAACNLFPGKSVVAGGWCKVWAQKPGA